MSDALRIKKRLTNGTWVDTTQAFLRNMDVIRSIGPDGRRVKSYCRNRDGTEVLTSLNYLDDASFEAAAQELRDLGLDIHLVKCWAIELQVVESRQSIVGTPVMEAA